MECAWPEVAAALDAARREVVVRGACAPGAPPRGPALPPPLFRLDALTLLSVSHTDIEELPPAVGRLVALRELLAFSNRLRRIDPAVWTLPELRVLDVSRNELERLPAASRSTKLTALNVSGNRLSELSVLALPTLRELDASHNEFVAFPDVCHKTNEALADLRLSGNRIVEVPAAVRELPALRTLDLADNAITFAPKELAEIPKLKDINLKGNKFTDNRLQKLINQCHFKQIIDYVRHNSRSADCTAEASHKKSKKSNKHVNSVSKDESSAQKDDVRVLCDKMYVLKCVDDTPNVVVNDIVKTVRAHIVCCIVRGINFTEDSFKKFIQMQNKLHDTVCEKRNAATIATHDMDKIPTGNLLYTARQPFSIMIQPLLRDKMYSGLELYSQLRREAENLRKEKKRNVFSGIHKYLYLLEGKSLYPCLEDSKGNVISFPPITNSDITKMSSETKTMFVEVTSASNQSTCRKVLDMFLLETMKIGIGGSIDDKEQVNRLASFKKLEVQQAKIVDVEGKMRTIYPSKVDLFYEANNTLKIVRE